MLEKLNKKGVKGKVLTVDIFRPIALSGDRTFNKDTIRKYVLEGSRVIPGCSTINFDEISKKRIFQSIDSANFNDIKMIKNEYKELKLVFLKIKILKI